MTGGQHKPYRLPATGSQFCGVGTPYSHSCSDVITVKFVNNTVVTLPDESTGPAYQRFHDGTSTNCAEYNCFPESATCGPWIGCNSASGAEQYTLVAGYDNSIANTFSQSGTVNFSVCRKKGWKAVMAHVSWYGQFGWLYDPETGLTNGVSDPPQTRYRTRTSTVDFAWENKTVSEIYDGAYAGTYTHRNGKEVGSGALTGTVDRLTGELTQTTADLSNVVTTVVSDTLDIGCFYGPLIEASASDTTDTYCETTTTRTLKYLVYDLISSPNGLTEHFSASQSIDGIPFVAQIPESFLAENGYTITRSPTGWSITAEFDADISGTDPYTHEPMTVTQTYTYDISVVRSNTSYTFEFASTYLSESYPIYCDEAKTSVVGQYHTESYCNYTVTIDLEDAEQASTVYTDCLNLLDEWDLSDDAQYPWRTDEQLTVNPLVTRNQIPTEGRYFNGFFCQVEDKTNPTAGSGTAEDPYHAWSLRDWFDPEIWCWLYPPGETEETSAAIGLTKIRDGGIIGAPNPAGYQDYFDFDFTEWRGCCNVGGEAGEIRLMYFYPYGYGKWLSAQNADCGAQIPLNATHWTNNLQSMSKRPFAFASYNDYAPSYGLSCDAAGIGDNAGFWVQKYAEVKELWQSQNFARPAGDDKFAFDEDHIWRMEDGGGGTYFVYNPGIEGSSFAPESLETELATGIWGSVMLGGFYTGLTYSHDTGVLSTSSATKVYNVPDDYTTVSEDQDNCFGKLRFPSCPSLLGRVYVEPSGGGTIFTFSTPQKNFGMTVSSEEQVDLYDLGMNLLASDITATRTSNTSFTIEDEYPTAHYVMIHGAAKWYCNDNHPKGDFLTLTFDYKVGTEVFSSFSQTQRQLPFRQHNPAVVCFTPNGESFANGITVEMPSNFTADEHLGHVWQGVPVFTVNDLLWQSPHKSVEAYNSDSWKMDGGYCTGDFPMAPQVEARSSLPNVGLATPQSESVPSLPAGITIGFLSPVDYPLSTDGVALPPGKVGFKILGRPIGADNASRLHDRLCGGTSCEDPFGIAYTKTTVGC